MRSDADAVPGLSRGGAVGDSPSGLDKILWRIGYDVAVALSEAPPLSADGMAGPS